MYVPENYLFFEKSPILLQKPDFACSDMFKYHLHMFTRPVTSCKLQKWILRSKENIFYTLMVLIGLIEKKLWVLENHYFCQKWVQHPSGHVRQLFSFRKKTKKTSATFFFWKFSLTFCEENFHWLFKKKIFIDFSRRKILLTFQEEKFSVTF